jgi:regulator of RNase E activity RraA
VVIGGVGVIAGQQVSADSSGVVVIPDAQIDQALAQARSIQTADATSRERIARERIPGASRRTDS